MAGAFAPVDPPLNGAPRLGLLASVTPIEDGGRWLSGFEFTPETCAGGDVTSGVCGATDAATPEALEASVQWRPVVLEHAIVCGPSDDAEMEARARRAFLARQSALLANELWLGTQAQASSFPNEYLAHAASDTDLGDQGLLEGFALIQQALGEAISGRGMLHTSYLVASHLYAADAIRREGNLLLDVFDNIVVADAGYPDDNLSIYGTSMVAVRLGPIKVIGGVDGFNRNDNLTEVRVQRPAAAYWDGCAHLRVDVDPCDLPCAAN